MLYYLNHSLLAPCNIQIKKVIWSGQTLHTICLIFPPLIDYFTAIMKLYNDCLYLTHKPHVVSNSHLYIQYILLSI